MLLSYIVSDQPGYAHVSALTFVSCDVLATVCARILENRVTNLFVESVVYT